MLMRTPFTPDDSSASMIATLRVAGPSVARILALLTFVYLVRQTSVCRLRSEKTCVRHSPNQNNSKVIIMLREVFGPARMISRYAVTVRFPSSLLKQGQFAPRSRVAGPRNRRSRLSAARLAPADPVRRFAEWSLPRPGTDSQSQDQGSRAGTECEAPWRKQQPYRGPLDHQRYA